MSRHTVVFVCFFGLSFGLVSLASWVVFRHGLCVWMTLPVRSKHMIASAMSMERCEEGLLVMEKRFLQEICVEEHMKEIQQDEGVEHVQRFCINPLL